MPLSLGIRPSVLFRSVPSRKAREREYRRAKSMVMLNPLRDKNEGTCRGGGGKTPIYNHGLLRRRIERGTLVSWIERLK